MTIKKIILREGLVCICLILSFVICYITPIEAEWLMNKQPVTDNLWAKTKGKFGAILFFTDKKKELFKKWLKDTEYVDIDIETEKIIKRHIPITALIIFSNCTPDRNGMANVTVSYTVYGPNGDIYAKTDELEVWINKPVPRERILELSVNYMTLTIKDNNPNGFYLVKAVVHDKNSNTTLELERQFQVVD